MDAQTQNIITILNDPRYMALFLALLIWSLIWKGFALWRSAHNYQMRWFVALLIFNTFGILEMVYLFYFQKRQEIEPPKA
jgi:methionyl-tRNA synthetase